MLISYFVTKLLGVISVIGTAFMGLVLYRPFQKIQTTTTTASTYFITTTQSPSTVPASLNTCLVEKVGSSSVNCGSCIDVTGTGGTIQSFNYPQEYLDNSNCRYTITAVSPSGKKIKLKFVEFVLEDCGSNPCDVLSLFDGTTSSSSLGVFTGVTNPSDITSTSNKMTIVFSADEGNAQIPIVKAPGRWKATYTLV